MITLDIVVQGGDWRSLVNGPDGIEELASRAAEAALAAAGHAGGEVEATLLLADDGAVQALNRHWRGIDRATNVLSFPSEAPTPPGHPRHLGDIAVAYETVTREARQEGKRPADHLAHLVVHGLLHLLGRDHVDPQEGDAMEAVEVAALARLGIADPYAATGPGPGVCLAAG